MPGVPDPTPAPGGDGPLLVFGPRSITYDFGPSHPLTPRRFGTGISLLEALGAVPGLAPEPATDEELGWIHDDAYIEHVKRASRDPDTPPRAGIGPGDTPRFDGMHEASAAVAGGSLRAMEAILRGDVEHAFHPGGGLHHAMPARASGFCVYDDPALAIARARRDDLRVMYIDLDVHHGDGVQAIHWADPGVLTVSIHETGLALFPGTGFPEEMGGGAAVGTKVNLPLDPGTGERGWLPALELALPALAERFQPEVIVSQHGADAHAFDPARAPARHDDGDGRGRPPRRLAGPPLGGRPLARDRRRRLRRLPGRASDVGPRLAGGEPPRRAARQRRPSGATGGPRTPSATARLRCPRPSTTRRMPACRTAPRTRPPTPGRCASRKTSSARS